MASSTTVQALWRYLMESIQTYPEANTIPISAPAPLASVVSPQQCARANASIDAAHLTLACLVTFCVASGLFLAYFQAILRPRIAQLEADDAARRALLASAGKLVNDPNHGALPGSDSREATAEQCLRLYTAANAKEGTLNSLVPLVRQWSGNKALNFANPAQDSATPLVAAASCGNADAVWLLISQPSIDINLASGSGRSPFAMACFHGHTEVAGMLAALPATDINLADKDGTTPLLWAVDNGRQEIVELLVTHPRLDVNKSDNSGVSALMAAAQLGNVTIAGLLLSHPLVIVNKCDDKGINALRYAIIRGHEGVAEALRRKGAK